MVTFCQPTSSSSRTRRAIRSTRSSTLCASRRPSSWPRWSISPASVHAVVVGSPRSSGPRTCTPASAISFRSTLIVADGPSGARRASSSFPGPSCCNGIGTSAGLAVGVTVGSAARSVARSAVSPMPATLLTSTCARSSRSPSTNATTSPGDSVGGVAGRVCARVRGRTDRVLERAGDGVQPRLVDRGHGGVHGRAVDPAVNFSECRQRGAIDLPPGLRVPLRDRVHTRRSGKGAELALASAARGSSASTSGVQSRSAQT